MQLVNKTRLDTKDLERFVERGLRIIGGDRTKLKTVLVRWWRKAFDQEKNGDITFGYAEHSDGTITLCIPRDFGGSQADVTALAQIYQHELEHLILGWEHDTQMSLPWVLPVFWATGVKIRIHPTRRS